MGRSVEQRLHWPTWIGVVADDLDAQRSFYTDVLGLTEKQVGDGWAEFDLDGHLFELIERQALPQYDGTRYQVGFTVEDIEVARATLIGRGVEAISEIQGGAETLNRWCYFRDPEGNVFEITEWRTMPAAKQDDTRRPEGT